MSLASDKITCQESCGDHVFSCGNGRCIPSDWQCDGTEDCKDFSDEANCSEVKITKCNNRTQATCGDGACVLSSWWCDGDEDCPDASDEENCPAVNCGDGRISCADGKQCVLEHWKCDGSEDCNDGSDEIGCDVKCLPGDFQCKDEKLCIEQLWVCDHNLDCSDGSDERNCSFTPQKCTRSEFKCSNNNCVSMELFCNGDNDCGDNSDEAEEICHRRTEDPFTDTITCVGGFACGPECL